MIDDVFPTTRESIKVDIEVPKGNVHLEAQYFAGCLDEAYDWLKVGIEKATEAALAQLNEQWRHQ